MDAATAAKQNDTEMGAEVIRVIMELAKVEASLSDSSFMETEECLSLYYRREKLVMRLAWLGAAEVLERIYKSARSRYPAYRDMQQGQQS